MMTSMPTPTTDRCPTITKTGQICSTCIMPMCIALSTISKPCGWPTPVPELMVDYPCASTGCRLGCGTSYELASAISECESTMSTLLTGTSTRTPPCSHSVSRETSSCVATVTVNYYPPAGCTVSFRSAFCVIDSKRSFQFPKMVTPNLDD